MIHGCENLGQLRRGKMLGFDTPEQEPSAKAVYFNLGGRGMEIIWLGAESLMRQAAAKRAAIGASVL